ncbi:MAG: LPXTG cell wall anchor domain-containing protein, partial [Clostridia bacterium]|nr:LPXTG cell wall anchor domain-containing protein [Clostridia bacterium]
VTFQNGKATVSNAPGSKLPSTGGIGAGIFYALGAAFILGAAAAFGIRSRKKAARARRRPRR